MFDTARALGLNTAVVGWFHPYGRVLNRSVTECYWTAGWLLSGIEEPFQPDPLPLAMLSRARLQVAALPLVGHFPGVFTGAVQREQKLKKFRYLMERARAAAADPSIGLVLVHLRVPHPPAIYSRAKDKLTAEPDTGYLDSVSLADRTLGELRRAIDRAGLRDRTAPLIGDNHGWRTYLWRGSRDWHAENEAASRSDTSGVPFVLRLPGQRSRIWYGRPFNTLVTRQIVTEILDGRLAEPNRIADSIERFRVEGQPLPVTRPDRTIMRGGD